VQPTREQSKNNLNGPTFARSAPLVGTFPEPRFGYSLDCAASVICFTTCLARSDYPSSRFPRMASPEPTQVPRIGKVIPEVGRMIMSYDPRLLFERILTCLQESPCKTLEDLSQSLRLSERTIQKAVNLSAGKSFRFVRDEVILIRVKWLFEEQPELPIKEVSFGVGFKSASSFARAVKRACGLSPEELRSRVAHECSDCTDFGTFECQSVSWWVPTESQGFGVIKKEPNLYWLCVICAGFALAYEVSIFYSRSRS